MGVYPSDILLIFIVSHSPLYLRILETDFRSWVIQFMFDNESDRSVNHGQVMVILRCILAAHVYPVGSS